MIFLREGKLEKQKRKRNRNFRELNLREENAVYR